MIAAALAVVVLASAGVLVYLFTDRADGSSFGDKVSSLYGGTDAAQKLAKDTGSERDAAEAVANQFMLRFTTYGPGDLDKQNQMPGYIARVEAVISAKLKVAFEQNVTLAEQSVAQTGVARTTTVLATGVSSMDADSASVLVAAVVKPSYPNPKHPLDKSKRIQEEPLPVRFDLTMVKIDGQWKVDNFTQVTGDDASGTGAPSGTATDQPTAPPATQPTHQPTSRPTHRPTHRPTGTGLGAGR